MGAGDLTNSIYLRGTIGVGFVGLSQVDVTLYRHGFHADTARTWMCGEEDEAGLACRISGFRV